MICKEAAGVWNLSPLGPFPCAHWTPMPQDPVGKGYWYPAPGKRDACFSLHPEGKFNPLSPEESACWACCRDPIPSVGHTKLFAFFVLLYFLFNDPSPMSTGASKPALRPPQPSAKPSKKIAQRHTGCQLFSGNVFMLLSSTVPDSSRFFQTKVYSTIEAKLCYAISLCKDHF